MQFTSTSISIVRRFGASILQTLEGNLILIGGVTQGSVTQWHDVVLLKNEKENGRFQVQRFKVQPDDPKERPLFIGVSSRVVGNKVVIAGGGATCFSMGTFWNPGVCTLVLNPEDKTSSSVWEHSCTADLTGTSKAGNSNLVPRDGPALQPQPVLRMPCKNQSEFQQILAMSRPVIIEGLNVGSCVKNWTTEYLAEKISAQRQVYASITPMRRVKANKANIGCCTRSRYGDPGLRLQELQLCRKGVRPISQGCTAGCQRVHEGSLQDKANRQAGNVHGRLSGNLAGFYHSTSTADCRAKTL